MRDHAVDIDRSTTPAGLQLAARFNVAVPFIDRHLEASRATKPAIHSAAADVSYGQLAERIDRCGPVFKAAGIGRGERLLRSTDEAGRARKKSFEASAGCLAGQRAAELHGSTL